MTATPRTIIDSAYASASLTTEYTAANVRMLLQNFTVTNTDTASQTVSIHFVPSGGSASAENEIIKDRNLQPDETYDCPTLAGKVVESGGLIAVIASAGNAVVMNASGVEFSG